MLLLVLWNGCVTFSGVLDLRWIQIDWFSFLPLLSFKLFLLFWQWRLCAFKLSSFILSSLFILCSLSIALLLRTLFQKGRIGVVFGTLFLINDVIDFSFGYCYATIEWISCLLSAASQPSLTTSLLSRAVIRSAVSLAQGSYLFVPFLLVWIIIYLSVSFLFCTRQLSFFLYPIFPYGWVPFLSVQGKSLSFFPYPILAGSG
jgi:hypothetical protein